MRGRAAVVALLVAAAPLAGCLDEGGEKLRPANRSPETGSDLGREDERSPEEERNASSQTNASRGDEQHADTREEQEGNDTAEDDPRGNRTRDRSWPAREEASIRPGVDIVSHPDLDNACTANFVFASPDNVTLYVGTAAHCLTDRPIGDPVMVGGIEDAGTIAYCSWGTLDAGGGLAGCPPSKTLLLNGSRTNDFALVEIDDAHRGEVHPAVMHWGGPQGVLPDADTGDEVHTFGNTPYRDEVGGSLDPREGYVTCTLEDPDPGAPCGSANTTWVRFVGHTFGGDSGSPVLGADGEALGALLATVATGDVRVGNLDAALALLHERTELTVELQTAPPLAEGVLPSTGTLWDASP